MVNNYTIGNYFEDFEEGAEIQHLLSKTIFESDNNLFSLITMNHHPLHTNIDYASRSQFGKIVVPGTLVFSLVVGLSVPDISGKAIANLSYENIEHLNPTFVNDTLYAVSTIIKKTETSKKPDRGKVLVETLGSNQLGTGVIRFKRLVLIPKKTKCIN